MIPAWLGVRKFCAAITACALSCLATGALAQGELPMMHSVQVYGQTIRYYDVGSGPDLVLVHGLGSSAHFDWGRVIPELARHHRVIALDQLGFGASDKPLVAYGVKTWVTMLDGFIQARHITDFDLVGESLGGWIVADYTIQAQANHAMVLPRRLVLTDAAGHHTILAKGVPAFNRAISIEGVRSGLSSLFHDKSLITDDLVQKIFVTRLREGNQYTVDSFWKNIDDPDSFVEGKLGAISVPTLVVWGQDDKIVPLADGRDYAARIKGARLVIISDAGHGPAIEKPGAYLDAVLPFLDGAP